MTRYTHTMCMAFGADGEPDRVEVDATFDYLVAGSAVSDIRVLKIDGRAVAVADADLHDRIHDDLESGRLDDLLISLVTPSPQSVVVPEPLWMMHVIGPDDIYPAPDHAELARLAEAAGGEAWSLNDWRPEGEILVCGGDGSEYGLFATVNDDLPEVAAFIAAANPATVLALLSEIAALRGSVSLADRAADAMADRATQAERQRDELRKALETIGEMAPSTCETSLAHDMAQFASQALANQGADQ